jgi:pyruvate formate lyase activating enzyme
MSVAEVMKEVERDVVFFDESGGGVTLTGGEPLAQPLFAEAVLAECRARGIHTALDTCGLAAPEAFAKVAALEDLVLFDVKLVDPDLHAKYTGAPNDVILSNFQGLVSAGKPVIVRFPLIPGINDGEAEISAVAGLLERAGLRRIDLLPYHRIGEDKFKRLAGAGRAGGVPVPSAAHVEEVAGALRRRGLQVKVGG